MDSPPGDGEAARTSSRSAVVAGDYEMELGVPGGSRLALIPEAARKPQPKLVDALGPPGNELRAPTDFLEGVTRVGNEAADAVDDTMSLLEAAAHGGLANAADVNIEIELVLRALSRLDREGKHREEIEFAQALADVLALLERWWELVETLFHAFDAAKKVAGTVGDHGEAWVLHELGSLSSCAGRRDRADELLVRAREIRVRIGDHQGVAATTQNLALTRTSVMSPPPPWKPRPSGRHWCAIGSVMALVLGGAIGAVSYHHLRPGSHSAHLVTLLATAHGDASLTYSGFAATSGYNRFVEVRVYNPRKGKVVATSSRRQISTTGAYGGTIAFNPTLKPGQYYAQTSQRRGPGGARAHSNAYWFIVVAAVVPTAVPPGSTKPSLMIEEPKAGPTGVAPITVSGTSTNLDHDYVEVEITENGDPDGPQSVPTDVGQIKSGGSWTVDVTRTKFQSGLTYTAVAYIVPSSGVLDTANTISSQSVTFTYAEPSIEPQPSDGGT